MLQSHLYVRSTKLLTGRPREQCPVARVSWDQNLKGNQMNPQYSPTIDAMTVRYGVEKVDGLSIAYREAGNPGSPKLVLFHGWPSSSHQYRNLIPTLADRFHVISPDYPGFGDSDAPDPATFAYTFDNIAAIVGKFLKAKGFDKYGVYLQDYGGPIGFRIITKSPEVLEWITIQNTNAYEVGFTEAWGGLRNAYWIDRSEKNEAGVAALLELDTVKAVYLTGSTKPELMSPDNWNSDFHVTLSRTFGKQIQLDLFYDYRTNVGLYPKWQQFLREHKPKTIIFWGQDDIFFTREGGESFLRDLPSAELHRLSAGHFAVEDCLPYIASNMHRFFEAEVKK
jgi:pimeloyl-ACP methyl ester carboxylesterase